MEIIIIFTSLFDRFHNENYRSNAILFLPIIQPGSDSVKRYSFRPRHSVAQSLLSHDCANTDFRKSMGMKGEWKSARITRRENIIPIDLSERESLPSPLPPLSGSKSAFSKFIRGFF